MQPRVTLSPTVASDPEAAEPGVILRPRQARPVSRWQPTGRWLPVVVVLVVCLAPVLGADPSAGRGARLLLASLAGLTALAGLTRQPATARLAGAFTATLAAGALPWQLAWWPLPGVVGVGVYLLAGLLPGHREGHDPHWRPGRVGRADLALIAGLAALVAAVLLGYHALTAPTLQFGAGLLRRLPTWCLPLAGLGFITGNAATEEFLFRGMILTHLARAVGRWPALAVQALGFGLLNVNGYPHGLVGIGLTGGYGLLLGGLRLRTGGLLAGWISHVLADSLIFAFILQAATHGH